MRRITLPFSVMTIALGLAACHQGAAPTDNASDTATIDNAANPGNAIAAADTSADEATPPDIAAPTVAADAPAEQSTPIVEAAQTAATITSDSSVVRVAWNDGWAWKRDGQIIRTASHDGGRVSYFHPGADRPYLVQDGGRSYGYDDNGKLAHVYDHGGHPQPPSPVDQRDAGKFDQQARRDHDNARSAPPAGPMPNRGKPDHDGPGNGNGPAQGNRADRSDGNGHGSAPGPHPAPTSPASHDDQGRGDRGTHRGAPDHQDTPDN